MINFLNLLKMEILSCTSGLPQMNPIDFNEVLKIIAVSVSIGIVAVAVVISGPTIYEGYSDHNPATKKHGINQLIGGILAALMMWGLLTLLFGITW